MIAEITYNGGATYSIGAIRFKQGVTQAVTDAEVIGRCRSTAGFSVVVREEPKPAEKIIRKVVEPVAEKKEPVVSKPPQVVKPASK